MIKYRNTNNLNLTYTELIQIIYVMCLCNRIRDIKFVIKRLVIKEDASSSKRKSCSSITIGEKSMCAEY